MSCLVWIKRWHLSTGEKVNFLCHSCGFIYIHRSKRAYLLTNLPISELKHITFLNLMLYFPCQRGPHNFYTVILVCGMPCSCKASTVLYLFLISWRLEKCMWITFHRIIAGIMTMWVLSNKDLLKWVTCRSPERLLW